MLIPNSSSDDIIFKEILKLIGKKILKLIFGKCKVTHSLKMNKKEVIAPPFLHELNYFTYEVAK